MSRGDESRIEEWVRYHAAIGITDFYVILDDPIDDTESVLKKVCDELKVGLQIDIKEAFGEYYNELPAEEWRARNSAWRDRTTAAQKRLTVAQLNDAPVSAPRRDRGHELGG